MRQPRARNSRKKASRATNITARIPDDLVDTAPSDFDAGCVSCSLVFDDIYTVELCGDHFWCINCAIDQFTAATEDVELFPVHCCGKEHVLALQAVQYLLPKRVVQLYSTKLAEWTTERKVWCSNKNCGEFLPKRCYRKIERTADDWIETVHVGTVGDCSRCRKSTCLNCVQRYDDSIHYFDSIHICKLNTNMVIELPEYTQNCRSKQCPACKTPVELSDACNHMSCVCGHQYCFICLLPWGGKHDCPEYGDPPYDAAGRDARGLHVRTGLDEAGYDRLGQHKYYPSRAPPPLLVFARESAHDIYENFLPEDGPHDHYIDEFWPEPPDPNHAIAAMADQVFEPGLGVGDQVLRDFEGDMADVAPEQQANGNPAEGGDAGETMANHLDEGGLVAADRVQQDQPQVGAQPGEQASGDLLNAQAINLSQNNIGPPGRLEILPQFFRGPTARLTHTFDDTPDEDAMVTMFTIHEKRFERLNPPPPTNDSFDTDGLLAPTRDAIAYRDRFLVNIALLRPSRNILSYETIDLGHMTWFGLLDLSVEDLNRLQGSSDRSWKPVHSRKYAYDTIYGFEPQGVGMYLEKMVAKDRKLEEGRFERFLVETMGMRGEWLVGDKLVAEPGDQFEHHDDVPLHDDGNPEDQFEHHDDVPFGIQTDERIDRLHQAGGQFAAVAGEW